MSRKENKEKNNGYFDAHQRGKIAHTFKRNSRREMDDIGVHKNTKIFHTLTLFRSKSMILPSKDQEFGSTTYTR
jgi:hypothetical protein